MPIGTKITRKADKVGYTIAAVEGGGYVLVPDEFGPPIGPLPLSALVKDYNVPKSADLSLPLSEGEALRARDERANATISQVYGRHVARDEPRSRPPKDQGESPEDVFRRLSGDRS